MFNQRFILQPYKGPGSRFTCPACNKPREFTRYVDIRGETTLPDYVGICNRAVKCGYHVPSSAYFKDDPQSKPEKYSMHDPHPIVKQEIGCIPVSLVDASFDPALQNKNRFIKFLLQLCGEERTMQLVKQFHIGSSSHWPGSTIFWQIDNSGRVRTGKIMLYDPDTGKRIREPFSHIAWVHSALVKSKQLASYNLQQCLFGLHQAINLPEGTPNCHCGVGKDCGPGIGLFP